MFRWGILSTAKIGREHVIPGIVQSDNGVLYGIASRDLAKAQALATQFGAKMAYGSYEAMLADPDIDGIYIPLPTSQHVEWTIKCADAGKHVLCEKPISLKASEIDDLIAAQVTALREASHVEAIPDLARRGAQLILRRYRMPA